MLFAAVDRPLPKDLLNHIAYAHCIPVVFGGVRVATKPDGSLADAAWSVVRAGPGSRCLRCDGQYTTSDVMMERDGSLDDPTLCRAQTRPQGESASWERERLPLQRQPRQLDGARDVAVDPARAVVAS